MNKQEIDPRVRAFLKAAKVDTHTGTSTPIKPSDVPVQILNWNLWEETIQCLASVTAAEPDAMIWVIDNGSDQDRSAECAEACPSVRVIRLEDNLGYAGAYKVAVDIALAEGYPAVYLLNNDTTARSDFLSAAVTAMNSDDRSAAVGSLILHRDGSNSIQFDGWYYAPGTKPYTPSSGVEVVDEVNGAGMLLRSEAVRQIGGLNPNFFCYGEESDWCCRANERGWRCVVAKGSCIEHEGSSSDISANKAYYLTRNQFLFAHGRPFRRKLTIYRNAFSQITWGLQRARQASDRKLEVAYRQGFFDAMTGRFGQRTPRASHALSDVLLNVITTVIRVCAKFGWKN